LLHARPDRSTIASSASPEHAMSASRIPVFPAGAWRFCAALLFAAPGLALAVDGPEAERLAAILRQLDLIDRQAESAAQVSPGASARTRFDYLRLREDLLRIRTGVNDYLAPRRAQPRDPLELHGDYRQSASTNAKAVP
jgi:RAQPRD family integrative conjugative element protein